MNIRIVSITARSAATRILFSVSLLLAGNVAGARTGPPSAMHGQRGTPDGVITNAERVVLHDDIVHYRYEVRVGPGEFDVIRLHRVVKERWPYWPIRTLDGVLMLPGTANFFEGIFMAPSVSSVLPWDHSVAAHLAKNDVDVWGMDYAWSLVPAETSDFGFMQGWGLARDIRHADIALGLAQRIRRGTGQVSRRLHLLGFSYGVPIAYALAAEEAQKSHAQRKIKGIIPVDAILKTNDEPFRLDACAEVATHQASIDAGTFQRPTGVNFKLFAELAETAPDDPSQVVSSLTNRQFFLFALTSGTFRHFSGGDTEKLLFSDLQVWLDFAKALPPYAPLQTLLDVTTAFCDESDVPFDDHQSEIAVPILYVGAAGGFGQLGVYDTTLTASTDVTTHIVGPLVDDLRSIDFGHADLFLAEDAEVLVWEPMLEWIKAHARTRGNRSR